MHVVGKLLIQTHLDEAILRKRIQELQHYRRLGLCTSADIDKYEHDLAKRVCQIVFAASLNSDGSSYRHKSKLRLEIMTGHSTVAAGGNPPGLPIQGARALSLANLMTVPANQRHAYQEQQLRLLADLVSPSTTTLKTQPDDLVAAPLNLANSPSLHLLTPAEQTLCAQLRILPKPYLVIKEILVREYARRGGKLR